MRYSSFCAVITLALLVASNVSAQAPDNLSFQGFLTDTLGNPVDSTNVGMTFKLYKGGTAVWTEPRTLDIKDGVFNVILGEVTPLDTVAFNQAINLGIKLDNEVSEMSPRTPLAATAYARALPGLYTFYRDDLNTNMSYNVVGGAPNNVVGSGVTGATIGGGGGTVLGSPSPNSVIEDFGTVGGGRSNTASGWVATVGGGSTNTAGGSHATVAGGRDNWAGSSYATIAGGQRDTASSDWATVGGGEGNKAGGGWATVSGGSSNKASGSRATVAGGSSNTASGTTATVGGGSSNKAGNFHATVPGGLQNDARGFTSFAAGYKARAIHDGTFVWNDRSIISANDSLLSTAANQFIIRAKNGVGINRAPASFGIHLKQNGTAQQYGIRTEDAGGDTDYWDTWIDSFDDYSFNFNGGRKSWIDDTDGQYVVFSDASLKEDVKPYRDVLANIMQLHPSTYRFKQARPSSPRSLGIIAQEVEPLFPELVSEKDGLKGMNYSGLSVVAIKAIQELYALVQQQQAEMESMQAAMKRAGLR